MFQNQTILNYPKSEWYNREPDTRLQRASIGKTISINLPEYEISLYKDSVHKAKFIC